MTNQVMQGSWRRIAIEFVMLVVLPLAALMLVGVGAARALTNTAPSAVTSQG